MFKEEKNGKHWQERLAILKKIEEREVVERAAIFTEKKKGKRWQKSSAMFVQTTRKEMSGMVSHICRRKGKKILEGKASLSFRRS